MRPTHDPPEKGILIGKPWAWCRGWSDFDTFGQEFNPFHRDDTQYDWWQEGYAARKLKEAKGDEAVYYKFVEEE